MLRPTSSCGVLTVPHRHPRLRRAPLDRHTLLIKLRKFIIFYMDRHRASTRLDHGLDLLVSRESVSVCCLACGVTISTLVLPFMLPRPRATPLARRMAESSLLRSRDVSRDVSRAHSHTRAKGRAQTITATVRLRSSCELRLRVRPVRDQRMRAHHTQKMNGLLCRVLLAPAGGLHLSAHGFGVRTSAQAFTHTLIHVGPRG